jgi:hypothetical protein
VCNKHKYWCAGKRIKKKKKVREEEKAIQEGAAVFPYSYQRIGARQKKIKEGRLHIFFWHKSTNARKMSLVKKREKYLGNF